MNKEIFLGVEVTAGDSRGVLEEVDSAVENRKPTFIVAINPEKIIKANNDLELKKLINEADIKIPDGIGVIMASKLSGGNIRKRVTGIDLMNAICRRASEKGYKVFLFGAAPSIAEKAGVILTEKYKGIKIVGTADGYYKDESEIISKLEKASPDILFIALGSPKQEYFIRKYKHVLNIPVMMGVGGSFDVTCGNIKRAPLWMRNCGLEWLYRLMKEPRRIKRQMALPMFLIDVLQERVKK